MSQINDADQFPHYFTGGTEITIQGLDLNTTQAVSIGDQQVTFTRSLDTEIKVVLPPMPAGAYPVKLLGPSGLAVSRLVVNPGILSPLVSHQL